MNPLAPQMTALGMPAMGAGVSIPTTGYNTGSAILNGVVGAQGNGPRPIQAPGLAPGAPGFANTTDPRWRALFHALHPEWFGGPQLPGFGGGNGGGRAVNSGGLAGGGGPFGRAAANGPAGPGGPMSGFA